MIAEVRGARILDGVRGAKPADVAALKKLLVQVSELVTQNPEIEELDLNPIFVSPRGVQIADARIVLASARAFRRLRRHFRCFSISLNAGVPELCSSS